MLKYLLFFFMFVMCSGLKVSGQSLPPIQLDRPDQTECSYIVPKKHFQVENGFNYESVDGAEKNFLYPTSLWKYGINNNMELRLITEITRNEYKGKVIAGIEPVRIGFKTKLLEEKGIVPLTSFIAHLALPTIASNNFKATYFAPSFRFTMQHTLSDKISLGYNLGAEWDGESAEPTFLYTLTTGFSLSEKFGAYIELYGFAPQKNTASHNADGGITYLIKQNIMLDISGGFGITKNAPDYYTSLGFSIRLPH